MNCKLTKNQYNDKEATWHALIIDWIWNDRV